MTTDEIVFDPFSEDFFNGAYETDACAMSNRSTTTPTSTSTH